jgi:hypothetical protein
MGGTGMSKPCPCCGYQDLPTGRQMLRRYKKAFGDMPIMAMIKRGWIFSGFTNELEWPSVDQVRDELKRFFGEDYDDVQSR